jgi:tetratricopeptide (TPR) repeat protein
MGEHGPAYEQFLELNRQSPENAEVLISLGLLAVQMERHAAARKHLHELIRLEEMVDVAFFYLGRSAEMEQRSDEAISWYRQVKQGQDLLVDAQTRIARLYVKQGDVARAHALLQTLRRQMPAREVHLYMLEGEILQQTGNQERVLALYALALKKHPGNRDLLYARALYGASHDMVTQAEQDLQQVIKGDPADADALNALGYILVEHTERYREALGYIERALALDPESAAILDSMGWAKFRLGDNREALKYMRRAFKQLPDSEIAAHLGEILWASGDKMAAQKVWQEALEKWPDSDYLIRTIKRLKQ